MIKNKFDINIELPYLRVETQAKISASEKADLFMSRILSIFACKEEFEEYEMEKMDFVLKEIFNVSDRTNDLFDKTFNNLFATKTLIFEGDYKNNGWREIYFSEIDINKKIKKEILNKNFVTFRKDPKTRKRLLFLSLFQNENINNFSEDNNYKDFDVISSTNYINSAVSKYNVNNIASLSEEFYELSPNETISENKVFLDNKKIIVKRHKVSFRNTDDEWMPSNSFSNEIFERILKKDIVIDIKTIVENAINLNRIKNLNLIPTRDDFTECNFEDIKNKINYISKIDTFLLYEKEKLFKIFKKKKELKLSNGNPTLTIDVNHYIAVKKEINLKDFLKEHIKEIDGEFIDEIQNNNFKSKVINAIFNKNQNQLLNKIDEYVNYIDKETFISSFELIWNVSKHSEKPAWITGIKKFINDNNVNKILNKIYYLKIFEYEKLYQLFKWDYADGKAKLKNWNTEKKYLSIINELRIFKSQKEVTKENLSLFKDKLNIINENNFSNINDRIIKSYKGYFETAIKKMLIWSKPEISKNATLLRQLFEKEINLLTEKEGKMFDKINSIKNFTKKDKEELMKIYRFLSKIIHGENINNNKIFMDSLIEFKDKVIKILNIKEQKWVTQ